MNSGHVMTRLLSKSRSSSVAALTRTVTELSYCPLDTNLHRTLQGKYILIIITIGTPCIILPDSAGATEDSETLARPVLLTTERLTGDQVRTVQLS